jgi:putative nucleotidyltransferase with HDIG domain
MSRWLWSFRTKVMAAIVAALLLVLALSHLLIYRSASQAQFDQLRSQLMILAQTASLLVDADALERIPDAREGARTPEYVDIYSRLKRVRELNPSIRYIYTLKPSDVPGHLKFAVDLDPDPEDHRHRGTTAYPGDLYDAREFPEMFKAFAGPAADRELVEDAWGVALSGYAPVRNAAGKAVAILGVDMDARDVRDAQRRAVREARRVLVIGVLVSLLIGALLARSLTGRVTRLIEGTRGLSSGDLSVRVKVGGRDEIADLGRSFNEMAAALFESRAKIEAYFCNVMEALVRMLEAKDKYTQGHSERVGVYAKKIALKLGFPEKEADLLRRAGELHDIGKLAVHEHVLNKVEPLTDAEWEMIRRHPVTGYETLKTLGLDEIIMNSIRSHHERVDGTGYPRRLGGDQAGIHAQIVAVADAYDAMTTTRPYRKAMDRRAAMEELRRSAGTQFNGDVVEALIRALEEDLRFQ